MKTFCKKVILLLLLISYSANTISADEVGDIFEYDGIKYVIKSINPNTVSIGDNNRFSIFGSNPIKIGSLNLSLPEKVKSKSLIEYIVTEIEPSAFYQRYDITSVKIPETIEIIGNRAFECCN